MDIASLPLYFVGSGWVGIDSQYYGFRYAGTNAYDWTSKAWPTGAIYARFVYIHDGQTELGSSNEKRNAFPVLCPWGIYSSLVRFSATSRLR